MSQQSEYFLLEVSLNKSIRRPEEYKKKVAEYVKKYATEEALRDQCGGEQVHTDIWWKIKDFQINIVQDDLSSSSESSMSDFSEDEAKDMEL